MLLPAATVITSDELATELQCGATTLGRLAATDPRFKGAKLCRGRWLVAPLRAAGVLPSAAECAIAHPTAQRIPSMEKPHAPAT